MLRTILCDEDIGLQKMDKKIFSSEDYILVWSGVVRETHIKTNGTELVRQQWLLCRELLEDGVINMKGCL